MMAEYRIHLNDGEALTCDDCPEGKGLKGKDEIMWFTEWDDMGDDSFAITKIICDKCHKADPLQYSR